MRAASFKRLLGSPLTYVPTSAKIPTGHVRRREFAPPPISNGGPPVDQSGLGRRTSSCVFLGTQMPVDRVQTLRLKEKIGDENHEQESGHAEDLFCHRTGCLTGIGLFGHLESARDILAV